jgi:hypothetical protein
MTAATSWQLPPQGLSPRKQPALPLPQGPTSGFSPFSSSCGVSLDCCLSSTPRLHLQRCTLVGSGATGWLRGPEVVSHTASHGGITESESSLFKFKLSTLSSSRLQTPHYFKFHPVSAQLMPLASTAAAVFKHDSECCSTHPPPTGIIPCPAAGTTARLHGPGWTVRPRQI